MIMQRSSNVLRLLPFNFRQEVSLLFMPERPRAPSATPKPYRD